MGVNNPFRSPLDAPLDYQANVEEFKILVAKLGCELHYAPTSTDNPPDTVIVTNEQILEEQAATQQVLETLLMMGKFMWDGKTLTYGEAGQTVEAGTFIEAVYLVLAPEQEEEVNGPN